MQFPPGARVLLPDHEVIARMPVVPEDWRREVQVDDDAWIDLWRFLSSEYEITEVYPPKHQVFRALELTPLKDVRVVILGQDPYHEPGQAHGLAFSVPPATPFPPSLRSVLSELEADLGYAQPPAGNLDRWARQGVLLLNTALTVRRGYAGSHSNCGWETFTGAVLEAVIKKADPVVFILWGRHAVNVLRTTMQRMWAEYPFARSAMRKHVILTSTHPSPLSATNAAGGLVAFKGSRPFSRINAELEARGLKRIRWDLNPPGGEEIIYEAWTDGSGTTGDQPAGIGVVVDQVAVGWTGRPCEDCKGSGEHNDLGRCPPCGGTGDEYGEVQRERLHEVSESCGLGTNNHAELSAVARALELVPREARLIIRADSQYAIGCASNENWNPKVNKVLINDIRRELRARPGLVTFKHVKGHAGDPGNELADQLAGAARRAANSQPITI